MFVLTPSTVRDDVKLHRDHYFVSPIDETPLQRDFTVIIYAPEVSLNYGT